MKRKDLITIGAFAVAIALVSCNKVEDGKVVEDTYTGNVIATGGVEPDGDFTGSGDNGTYSFGWQNNQTKAEVNFDITTPTGSLQFILEDADKNTVLDKTRSAGGNDTFSGQSSAGTPGVWLVKLIFSDFNGDGSYSIEPVD